MKTIIAAILSNTYYFVVAVSSMLFGALLIIGLAPYLSFCMYKDNWRMSNGNASIPRYIRKWRDG